jgi:hypothetical protein
MPKVQIHEVRRLIFPLETAVDAVLELDREHGGALARALLTEARIEPGADGGLVLAVRRAGFDSIDRRRYSLSAVAAAVIHYCGKIRIPLPRHGTKSMEIVPEGFALTIQASAEVLRRHGPLPARVGAARSGSQPNDRVLLEAEQPVSV